MEQLFETFEAELTAHYPHAKNAVRLDGQKEAHFWLTFSDFDIDILFSKNSVFGAPHFLGAFLYEKDGYAVLSYCRALFALCNEKKYTHIEFAYIATEEQLREALALLTGSIDRNIPALSDFMADEARRKSLFAEFAEEANLRYKTVLLRHDGARFSISDEHDEESAERAIEICFRMSMAEKYSGAFLHFYKGDPKKALEKLCQKANKGAELSAIAELAPEAVEIPPLVCRLYKEAHKGNFRMLLAEACSWAVGSFFLALPTYFALLGIYLLAAGVLDDAVLFSTTAAAGAELYLYPLIPALFSGVLATAFSSKFCYRVLYGRKTFRDYYAMLQQGGQKTVMRLFACLVVALVSAMAFFAGSAGVKFEEHRVAHTEIGQLSPQYYSYDSIEKAVLQGEEAAVELHLKNGEILPLHGISVKQFHIHLEDFLTEKGIDTELKG